MEKPLVRKFVCYTASRKGYLQFSSKSQKESCLCVICQQLVCEQPFDT